MASAMDLMQLNPFVRRAVILMTGLRLTHTADVFALDVLTIIPGYVVELALAVLLALGVPLTWARRCIFFAVVSAWRQPHFISNINAHEWRA